MEVVVARSVEFRPEWNNNEHLPEHEQLVFHLNLPTVQDRKRFVAVVPSIISGAGGTQDRTVSVQTDYEELVRTYTRRIDGLTVKDETGTTVAVRDAKTLLLQPGMHGLVQEVGAYLAHFQSDAEQDDVDPTSNGHSGSGSGERQLKDVTPAAK